MKELSLEESKKSQLGILVCIDKFCRKNNIQYSLAYGTLLGAVRHKGFIPWDDDIDIVMLRSEYEKFIATYNDVRYNLIKGDGISNHLHVVVSDSHTVVEYPKGSSDAFFYKGGLWVDVFPLDLVPESDADYYTLRKSISRRRVLQKLGELPNFQNENVNVLKKMARRILYYLLNPFKDINGNAALRLLQKYNNSKSSRVASLSVWYLSHNIPMPKKWFEEYCELEFEGIKFKSTKSYHDYLVSLYGDFMKLPPEEERQGKHHYKAYKYPNGD